MDEGTRLVERLAAMGHPLAGELAAVLDCVEVIAPQGTADSRQLAGIYDGRAGHLAQFQSPHADAFRRDTQALAAASSDLQDVPCEVWTFKRNEHSSPSGSGPTRALRWDAFMRRTAAPSTVSHGLSYGGSRRD